MTLSSSLFGGERLDVAVLVEIEKTWESFHAYAVPEGVTIAAGDTVLVHGAPTDVAFGERLVVPCRATLVRAGLLGRAWTRMSAMFELTELFEVGFQPQDAQHV